MNYRGINYRVSLHVGFDFKPAFLGVVDSFDDMVGFQHVLTIYQTLLGCMCVNCYLYSSKANPFFGAQDGVQIVGTCKVSFFLEPLQGLHVEGQRVRTYCSFHYQHCHGAISAFACTCHGLGFRLTSLFLETMYPLVALTLQPDTLHPNPRGPSRQISGTLISGNGYCSTGFR